MELDERKRAILCAIVHSYIVTGEPVGSKTLLEREGMNVSSATIRNEMNELEKLGYLTKTHTSSGRIPSNEGLRYYVTTALPSYRLSTNELVMLSPDFDRCTDIDEIMDTMVMSIASFSGCAVFAMSSLGGDGSFTFEVLPAGKRTIALLAESSAGTVRSRFARSDGEVDRSSLELFTRILNRVLGGFSAEHIGSVRLMLLDNEVRTNCPECAFLLPEVKGLAEELKNFDLHISGTSNLLSYPEFADIETARRFIDLLGRHERIVDALAADIFSGGISIRIGSENRIFDSPKASMIAISNTERIPTVIGVMGPTRMDYSRLIAGCNHVLTLLGRALSDR